MTRITIPLCFGAFMIAQGNGPVDATGEPKNLTRKIVSGTSGGAGLSLPVELQTTVVNGGSRAGDTLFVDFIITNRSKKPLILPVCLNAQDVEPKDSTPSVFQHLSLFLTVGPPRDPLLLKGGTNLYGAESLAGSLRTIQPSESLIVHTKFLLESWGESLSVPQSFTGHISLLRESLKRKGAGLESISDEQGSAISMPFTWTITRGK